MDLTPLNRVAVDFVMMADRADVAGGKLYVQGGAWDHIFGEFDKPFLLSFALGLRIPWNATNETHSLRVTVEDSDGQPVPYEFRGDFISGRPPYLEKGEEQRVVVANPVAAIQFPRPGRYTLHVWIDGEKCGGTSFRVLSKSG